MDQSRGARFPSGAVGGLDLKEVYGGGKQDEEGTGAGREEGEDEDEDRRPRMGRQK